MALPSRELALSEVLRGFASAPSNAARVRTRPSFSGFSRVQSRVTVWQFAPPLREALLVNQPLVLTKPSVPMRLVSDDEAANPTRPGGFTAITIRLEEAL